MKQPVKLRSGESVVGDLGEKGSHRSIWLTRYSASTHQSDLLNDYFSRPALDCSTFSLVLDRNLSSEAGVCLHCVRRERTVKTASLSHPPSSCSW